MLNAYLLAGFAMVFWGIAPIFGKLGLGDVQPLVALTVRSVIISLLLLVTVTIKGQWGLVAEVTAKNAMYIALEGICTALLGQLAYYYALRGSGACVTDCRCFSSGCRILRNYISEEKRSRSTIISLSAYCCWNCFIKV